MADLVNPRWMYLKAVLFLLIGAISASLILLEVPTLRTTALLLLCIWSFARAYYFAFYVIEKYIDHSFRFAGLVSVARHLLRRRVEPFVARQQECTVHNPGEKQF